MSVIPALFAAKCCAKMLSNIEYGVIHLVAPDNRIITAGGSFEGPEVTWKLHDWDVLHRFLVRGDTALGEDYMAGKWEADSPRNLRAFLRLNYKRLRRFSGGTWFERLLVKVASSISSMSKRPVTHDKAEIEFRDLLGEVLTVSPRRRDEEYTLPVAKRVREAAAIFHMSEFRRSQPVSSDTL